MGGRGVVAGCCGDKPCRIGRVNTGWPVGDLWWERHAAQRRHSQKIKGEVGLKRPPTVGSDKGDPPLDNWWTVHKTVGQEEVENIVPSQVFVHTLFSSMISKKSFESLWWDVVWWFSAATILQYHIKWVYCQLYSLKQNFLVFRTEGNLKQESNVTQIAPFGTFRAWLSADSEAVHPNRLSHPWHCLLYIRIKSWTCLRWHSLTAGSVSLVPGGRGEHQNLHAVRCRCVQTIITAVSCRKKGAHVTRYECYLTGVQVLQAGQSTSSTPDM